MSTVIISPTERFNLVSATVGDRRCGRVHIAVAYLLFCKFYNAETGRCDPSVASVAKAAATIRRYAQQAIHDLEKWGYLTIKVGGGGRGRFGPTNAYTPASQRYPSATALPQRHSATVALQQRDPQRPSATKPTKEPTKEGPPLFPPTTSPDTTGGKASRAAKASKRDPRLYLAKHGCTIDSYQPDPDRMGAWAAEKAPAVKNPVAPETVEDIKDVWRRRGERPKDFDATYRGYLRKRNEWATEKREASEAAHDPKRRAGLG